MGTVTEEHHDKIEKDKICSQSVLKDAEVEEGTKINLVISLGPKDEEKPVEDPDNGKEPDGDTTTDPDDGNKEPTDEQPDKEPETAPVAISVDLSAHKDSTEKVKVTVKSDDGNTIYDQSVLASDYAEKEYKLTLESAEYEVGTKITVTVDGETVETITVAKKSE